MKTPSSETGSKLDACIHCGMCLPACPTYRVTGSEAESPRGRIWLMRAASQGELAKPAQLANHLDPCLGCLACVSACPSGVDYESLLMGSRQALLPYQPSWKRHLRRFMLRHVLPNAFLLRFLAWGVSAYQRSGLQWLIRQSEILSVYKPLAMQEACLPDIEPIRVFQPGQQFGENRHGRVALFLGCIMQAAYSQTHWESIQVLVANGYQVVIPPQTCCGALAHHAGETTLAAELAQANVSAMNLDGIDWVVVNAAGCGAMLKHYDDLLGQSGFSTKMVDILELLAQRPLENLTQAVPLKVTYHAACHLHHAQGVQDAPLHVLSQIPGLELIPLTEADMCCGSAGVYNLAHPTLSAAILAEKMHHVAATDADVVLAANPGCMLQLAAGIREAGLAMTVQHPITLLAQAYTGDPETG